MLRCLERFDDYQMAYYEELCDYFKGRLHFLEKLKQFLEKAVSECEFCVRFEMRHLPNVYRDRAIRQLAEVGGGVTFGGLDRRKEVLRCLFNCRISQMEATDYPIFGYLTNPMDGKELIYNADMAYQYGTALCVLKKENMMDRTTMTFGDSVNFGACTRMVATRVNKIYPTCFQSLSNANSHNESNFGAPPTPSWFIINLCKALDEGKIDLNRLEALPDLFDGANGCEFIELQYHGGIRLDQDVKAIYGMAGNDGDTDLMKEYFPKIEALGIHTAVVDYGW